MKVVGLITEYNPFHNGHKYHIEEAKRITGADYVIAVMSGNFVQRGTPAVIDKYSRTEMALHNGIDLVLELPVCYSTGSAEYFAHGAVSLLNKLGIVDYLCFGSECGDIKLLADAARFLQNTPPSYDERLQALLKDGFTYPSARLKALEYALEGNSTIEAHALTQVLTEPNNILGIEYCKALLHYQSNIVPVTIQRIASGYHDTNLSDIPYEAHSSHNNKKVISSATAIRKALQIEKDFTKDYLEEIKHSVPENVFPILSANYLKTYPITVEDFAGIMKYKLLSEDNQSLAKYLDITSDLADRMKNLSDLGHSISDIANILKSKNMTLTRINRSLIHLLLNIHSQSMNEYSQNGYVSYARVLGIKKASSHLLRKIELNGSLPILTKLSRAEKQLDSLGMRMLSMDIFAAHIYNQAIYEKYKTSISNEYKHGIIVL